MDVLTSEEIDVLNEARTVLDKYAKRDIAETRDEARVSQIAEIAEHMIFKFVNHSNAYLHLEMSQAQLHNDREEVAS
jgi:hypothetical protein